MSKKVVADSEESFEINGVNYRVEAEVRYNGYEHWFVEARLFRVRGRFARDTEVDGLVRVEDSPEGAKEMAAKMVNKLVWKARRMEKATEMDLDIDVS